MGRTHQRIEIWSLLLITLVMNWALPADAHPFLADAALNKDWHAPESTGEAVYTANATPQAPPQIVFRMDALKRGPLSLSIETDAKDISVGTSASRFPLGARDRASKTIELILTADAERPSIQANGRELAPVRGKWTQLCTSGTPTVMVEFMQATYVNMKMRGAVDVNEAKPHAVPASGREPTTAPSGGLGQAGDFLERARQAVFQIRTFGDDNEVRGTGTGFLVRQDGLALTNFHVLQGASGATAVLPNSPDEITLELIAVRPELDLALIRLPKVNTAPLPFEKNPPRQGEDVWSLGYPLGLGYTVNRGIVAGIRRFRDLPDDIREQCFDYSPNSSWIQTDCSINPGNSGGPLVNSRGNVVGINTWLLSGRSVNNLFFALQIDHAAGLLNSGSEPTITFAEAKTRYKEAKVPGSSLPGKLPVIDLQETVNADQLSAAAEAVANGTIRRCPKCSGKGSYTVGVKVGERLDGIFRVPIYRDSVRQCDRCGGGGGERAPDASVLRLVNNLLTQLASAKRSDPKMADRLPSVYTAIRESIACDVVVLSLLTERSRSILAQDRPAPKTPIVVRAHYLLTVPTSDPAKKLHLAVVNDSSQLVVLNNAFMADDIEMREVVIAGLVAGTTKSNDGRRVIVLQNGCLVAIPNRTTR